MNIPKLLPYVFSAFTLTAVQPVLASEEELQVKFVDVGAGNCILVKAPGGQMIYDAGDAQGDECLAAAGRFFDKDKLIDLMVLSHSDTENLTAAQKFLDGFNITRVLRSGGKQESKVWQAFSDRLLNTPTIEDIDLSALNVIPGHTFEIGNASATFVAGWPTWKLTDIPEAEAQKVNSIVMRLDYQGASFLFTGDTVGRRADDPADACKDAEAWMVANQPHLIDVQILQAPHHGANNASSACFIQATSPHYVVMSAGHENQYPTAAAVQRYIDAGIREQNILRTDRGDDEGGAEWAALSIPHCEDKSGDDTVTAVIKQGSLAVKYDNGSAGC